MLVEFREAQYFFILASQIAVISILCRAPGNFGATGMVQLQKNWGLPILIGANSVFLALFTIITLHQVGMLFWYIFPLSCISIAISMATVCLGNFRLDFRQSPVQDFLTPVGQVGYLDKCGYHSPPTIYCQTDKWDSVFMRNDDLSGIISASYMSGSLYRGDDDLYLVRSF